MGLLDMEGFSLWCQVIEDDMVILFVCSLQPCVEERIRGWRTGTGI